MSVIDNLMPGDRHIGRFLGAIVERLALEGVPVCAIARGIEHPSDDVREVLSDAKALGRILEFPREDWPPGSKLVTREPAVAQMKFNDGLTAVLMQKYRLTRQESHVFAALLRRQMCTRPALMDVMKQTRADPQKAPQPKLLDVVVCQLRKRLTPHEVVITTLPGVGYSVDPDTRRRVLATVRILMDEAGITAGGPL